MSKSTEDEAKAKGKTIATVIDVATKTVPLAVATGVAAPLLPTTAPAVATALLALFPSAIQLIIPAVVERKRKRFEHWWEELTWSTASNEGVAAEVKAKLDDPVTQEVIFESLHVVLDSIADEVIPSIALVTREYALQGKSADRFFRGFTRLLKDLSGREYDDLRRLVSFAIEHGGDNSWQWWRLEMDDGVTNVTVHGQKIGAPGSGQKVGTVGGPKLVKCGSISIPSVFQLFHALKSHGLASDDNAGRYGMTSGPESMVITLPMAKSLLALLPPPRPSAP
jgi:hypothetical protein